MMDFLNKVWLLLFPGPNYDDITKSEVIVNYRKHAVKCVWNFNIWGLGTHKQRCSACFKVFEFDHHIDWTSIVDADPCLAPASTKRNTIPTASQNVTAGEVVRCECVLDVDATFQLTQVERAQYLAALIPPFTSDDIESLHEVLQEMPGVQLLSNTIGICRACTNEFVCIVIAQQPGWVYVLAGDIGPHFGPKVQVMSATHCPHPPPGIVPTVGYIDRVRRQLPHYGFLICPDDIDLSNSYQIDVGYTLDTSDGVTLKCSVENDSNLLPVVNVSPTIECDLYRHIGCGSTPQQIEVTREVKINKHDTGRLHYAQQLLQYYLPELVVFETPIGGYYQDLPAPKVWNHRPHSYYIGHWKDFYVGIEAYDYNMTITLVSKTLGTRVGMSPPFYTFMQNSSANCRPRQLVFEAGDVADLPATWIPPSTITTKLAFAHLKNWWSEGTALNIQRYASPLYMVKSNVWPATLCFCLIKSHRQCRPYSFTSGTWRNYISDKIGVQLMSKFVVKRKDRMMCRLNDIILEQEHLYDDFATVLIGVLDDNKSLSNIYRGIIDMSGCIPKYWRLINGNVKLRNVKVFHLDDKVNPLVVFNVTTLK
uniref:Uncharacterized protein n=1 Tax=Rhizoctonia cerealis hypovirus TaxID=3068667 RepID=A0AA51GJF2_9VIRU|nr:MAG: hypothetical protein [Rhizoctonia cerealis hypovirus]